jgi:hypothetical protein
MARVPVIESPCPIAARPLPVGASDHCAICDRTVHNLDRMTERERRDFVSSCAGKVCVAYTVRMPSSGFRRRALGTVALAALAATSLPLAAQDSPVVGMSPVGNMNGLPNCDELFDDVVVTGGVNKGTEANWAEDGKDAPPELPSIEDDGR